MEIDERLKPLEILRTINGCIVIRSSLYGESVYELMDNAIAHIREESVISNADRERRGQDESRCYFCG
jgi:hypothetical protein